MWSKELSTSFALVSTVGSPKNMLPHQTSSKETSTSRDAVLQTARPLWSTRLQYNIYNLAPSQLHDLCRLTQLLFGMFPDAKFQGSSFPLFVRRKMLLQTDSDNSSTINSAFLRRAAASSKNMCRSSSSWLLDILDLSSSLNISSSLEISLCMRWMGHFADFADFAAFAECLGSVSGWWLEGLHSVRNFLLGASFAALFLAISSVLRHHLPWKKCS